MNNSKAARRGRPRDEATEQAILASARELLARDGYDAVSIEGVARAAGVGKQTIYRRYDSKAELLIAAFRDDATVDISVTPQASLEASLTAFLTGVFKALSRTGPSLKFLMAQAQIDPVFGATFDEAFIAMRRASLTSLIRHHIPKAEQADIATSVDMLFGAMWYRLLLGHAPLTKGFAATLARHASAALRD